jgi:hypothetical protein
MPVLSRSSYRPVIAVLSALPLLSCGGGGTPAGPAAPSENPRHNVLVVDFGIDPSATVFSGKLIDLSPVRRGEGSG